MKFTDNLRSLFIVYAVTKKGLRHDEAEDVVQDLLAHLSEAKTWNRSYAYRKLNWLISNKHKRNGIVEFVPLDQIEEERLAHEDADDDSEGPPLDMALSYTENPDLGIDFIRALKKLFKPDEQRVLFEILVEHLTFQEVAAAHPSRSKTEWHKWYANTAIPQLREHLSDYDSGGLYV